MHAFHQASLLAMPINRIVVYARLFFSLSMTFSAQDQHICLTAETMLFKDGEQTGQHWVKLTKFGPILS